MDKNLADIRTRFWVELFTNISMDVLTDFSELVPETSPIIITGHTSSLMPIFLYYVGLGCLWTLHPIYSIVYPVG